MSSGHRAVLRDYAKLVVQARESIRVVVFDPEAPDEYRKGCAGATATPINPAAILFALGRHTAGLVDLDLWRNIADSRHVLGIKP